MRTRSDSERRPRLRNNPLSALRIFTPPGLNVFYGLSCDAFGYFVVTPPGEGEPLTKMRVEELTPREAMAWCRRFGTEAVTSLEIHLSVMKILHARHGIIVQEED